MFYVKPLRGSVFFRKCYLLYTVAFEIEFLRRVLHIRFRDYSCCYGSLT